MKNAYVAALTKSILTGLTVETALQNIKLVMKRKGHLRLWPQVLRASKRILEARLVSTSPQVIIAQDDLEVRNAVQSALQKLGVTEIKNLSTTVDSNLVGGFVIRFGGLLFDTSYKQALLKLYRSISKS